MTAPIRRRTRAREIAMQILFQVDLRSAAPGQVAAPRETPAAEAVSPEGATASARQHESVCRVELGGSPAELCQLAAEGDAEVAEFAARLVEGTLTHLPAIDARLQGVTRNWDLRRMANVDRNVLRMAIYELLFCRDVPPKVAINEAIELGKKFSTANSGGFVNGILDRVRIDIDRERAAARGGEGALDAGS